MNREPFCWGLLAGAIIIAASGHDGWGWCLFILFILVAGA